METGILNDAGETPVSDDEPSTSRFQLIWKTENTFCLIQKRKSLEKPKEIEQNNQ